MFRIQIKELTYALLNDIVWDQTDVRVMNWGWTVLWKEREGKKIQFYQLENNIKEALKGHKTLEL